MTAAVDNIGLVRSLAVRLARPYPSVSADDLAQEGLLAAIQQDEGWADPRMAAIGVYAAAVPAMRAALNRERRLINRLTGTPSRHHPAPPVRLVDVDPELTAWCQSADRRQGWPWLTRLAHCLRRVEGLSTKAIAKLWAVSEPLVFKWLRPPAEARRLALTAHARKRWAERFAGCGGWEASFRRAVRVSRPAAIGLGVRMGRRDRRTSKSRYFHDAAVGAVWVVEAEPIIDQLVTVIRLPGDGAAAVEVD